LIVLQYTEIAKSRGKLYACENQLYIQHSIKKGVRYLKCINDQNAEIERLQVLERCRKRPASSSTDTLRAIFNEETRAASECRQLLR